MAALPRVEALPVRAEPYRQYGFDYGEDEDET
jgi:hypothetical protein